MEKNAIIEQFENENNKIKERIMELEGEINNIKQDNDNLRYIG